jgi:hypothetical protein
MMLRKGEKEKREKEKGEAKRKNNRRVNKTVTKVRYGIFHMKKMCFILQIALFLLMH